MKGIKNSTGKVRKGGVCVTRERRVTEDKGWEGVGFVYFNVLSVKYSCIYFSVHTYLHSHSAIQKSFSLSKGCLHTSRLCTMKPAL